MPLIPDLWQDGAVIIGHLKAIFAAASAASRAVEFLGNVKDREVLSTA